MSSALLANDLVVAETQNRSPIRAAKLYRVFLSSWRFALARAQTLHASSLNATPTVLSASNQSHLLKSPHGAALTAMIQQNSPKASLQLTDLALRIVRNAYFHTKSDWSYWPRNRGEVSNKQAPQPDEKSRVERRQLHSMFFGQFGKSKISELSA